MYWKRSQSATTVARTTPIVPMSWIEIATPPISIVRVGNGLSTARTSPDQIIMISPLMKSSRPIVTITTRSTEPFSFGRITPWWMPTPPRNETTSVTANAGQYVQPWFVVSAHAM